MERDQQPESQSQQQYPIRRLVHLVQILGQFTLLMLHGKRHHAKPERPSVVPRLSETFGTEGLLGNSLVLQFQAQIGVRYFF